MAEIGVCARCGMICWIYDRLAMICFRCYLGLSPFANGKKRGGGNVKKDQRDTGDIGGFDQRV